MADVTNLLYQVESQAQELNGCQRPYILYLFDLVLVEIQIFELRQFVQILYLVD